MKKIGVFVILIFIISSCNKRKIDILEHDNLVMKSKIDSLSKIIKDYRELDNLKGTYVNVRSGLYHSIKIIDKINCIVRDNILGFYYTSTYVKDGNILYVKTDKSDLEFTVKDCRTLIGTGFSDGLYKK